MIQYTTEVLEHKPENVKALFRRARAHVGAWDPKEAKKDFEAVMHLDVKLVKTCKEEIAAIEAMEKIKDDEDKEKMTKLFN